MSDTVLQRINQFTYKSPYSGMGIKYYPLGITHDRTGIVLHEAGHREQNRDWNYPNVFSPFWRLYHNRDHGHRVLFGNRKVDLNPTRIVLIPDRQLFHCMGTNPVPHTWLHFSLSRYVSVDQSVPIILFPTETELCLIRDLNTHILDNETGEPTRTIQGFSLALLNIVLTRSEIRFQEEMPVRLVRITEFIENHINEKMPNDLLAKKTGISVEGLIRLFQKHLGTTPANYVTQVRIRFSSQLLIESDQTIDEIAETVGFPNRAYFSRVFKQVTGEPPATFRRLHRI